MYGNEWSGICLFKVIVSKSQVDSQSTIKLLLAKLTPGIPDLVELFGKNIGDFNKEIRSSGTDIRPHWEDPDKLFLYLFATYADCILDNGPFHTTSRCCKISTTLEQKLVIQGSHGKVRSKV